MTKSMFGMAITIIIMSLMVLLLPFFFAFASDEKCANALPDLWWGTPVDEVRWVVFKEKDPATDVEIYDWKPNHSPLFHSYGKTQARAKSFEFWFRNDKLIAVRAEFAGREFDKMLTILTSLYGWHHSRFHQDPEETFAEFIYVSCETEIVALKFRAGDKRRYIITWYYRPLCKGLLREEQLWTTPR